MSHGCDVVSLRVCETPETQCSRGNKVPAVLLLYTNIGMAATALTITFLVLAMMTGSKVNSLNPAIHA
jgi:hypothetical protein